MPTSTDQITTNARLEFGGDPYSQLAFISFDLEDQGEAGTTTITTEGQTVYLSQSEDDSPEAGQSFAIGYPVPGAYKVTVYVRDPEFTFSKLIIDGLNGPQPATEIQDFPFTSMGDNLTHIETDRFGWDGTIDAATFPDTIRTLIIDSVQNLGGDLTGSELNSNTLSTAAKKVVVRNCGVSLRVADFQDLEFAVATDGAVGSGTEGVGSYADLATSIITFGIRGLSGTIADAPSGFKGTVQQMTKIDTGVGTFSDLTGYSVLTECQLTLSGDVNALSSVAPNLTVVRGRGATAGDIEDTPPRIIDIDYLFSDVGNPSGNPFDITNHGALERIGFGPNLNNPQAEFERFIDDLHAHRDEFPGGSAHDGTLNLTYARIKNANNYISASAQTKVDELEAASDLTMPF